MIDQGLSLYLKEVKQHIKQYSSELDSIAEITQLSNLEYRSAERLLQLITEVSIGLSKHWLKSLNQSTGINAYQTFQQLQQQGVISAPELIEWRKFVDLRNTLVHACLERVNNVDMDIVKLIVKNKQYRVLIEFCQQAIQALESSLTY